MGRGSPFHSLRHSSTASMCLPRFIATNTLFTSSPGDLVFSPVRYSVPSSSRTNLYSGYDRHSAILFGIAAVPFSTAARAASTSRGSAARSSSSNVATLANNDVSGLRSASPLASACSTSTDRIFCISG
uniref:Uncharacterized protein n=1 Tax=Saccharum hybrid cultivar R570 TaxID=131158 RepID=A0A059Q1V0_9POAL|nr:hypothetical protein SHCRBa_019_F13_F_90 [Saccharum hybrid cultivar R570]